MFSSKEGKNVVVQIDIIRCSHNNFELYKSWSLKQILLVFSNSVGFIFTTIIKLQVHTSQGSFFSAGFPPVQAKNHFAIPFCLERSSFIVRTMKSTIKRMLSQPKRGDNGDQRSTNEAEWELRPGGMVVQKRNSDMNQNSALISTIKVKVKYGSSCHEIHISSHASFGELKKMLAGPTGLHPGEQKLVFKNKERASKSYLDIVGVKDGSKLVLVEDIESIERRRLEKLKIENKEKTSNCLTDINLEVEKFAKQVAALETGARGGGIAADMDVDNLTENLMRTLIKLEEIVAEGDLNLQRREQIGRVQKHIETLDMLKMPKPNSIPHRNESQMTCEKQVRCSVQKSTKMQKDMAMAEQMRKRQHPLRHDESVVVTTKWETFD